VSPLLELQNIFSMLSNSISLAPLMADDRPWHRAADRHCFQSEQLRPDNKPALTIWQCDRLPGSRMESSPPPSFSTAPPKTLPAHSLESVQPAEVRQTSVPLAQRTQKYTNAHSFTPAKIWLVHVCVHTCLCRDWYNLMLKSKHRIW